MHSENEMERYSFARPRDIRCRQAARNRPSFSSSLLGELSAEVPTPNTKNKKPQHKRLTEHSHIPKVDKGGETSLSRTEGDLTYPCGGVRVGGATEGGNDEDS